METKEAYVLVFWIKADWAFIIDRQNKPLPREMLIVNNNWMLICLVLVGFKHPIAVSIMVFNEFQFWICLYKLK